MRSTNRLPAKPGSSPTTATASRELEGVNQVHGGAHHAVHQRVARQAGVVVYYITSLQRDLPGRTRCTVAPTMRSTSRLPARPES